MRETERNEAFNELLEGSVSVHVISYTGMEIEKSRAENQMLSKTPPPKALPDEIAAQLPNGIRQTVTAPKIGPTINLDREMMRKMRDRKTRCRKRTISRNTRRRHERAVHPARNARRNDRQNRARRRCDRFELRRHLHAETPSERSQTGRNPQHRSFIKTSRLTEFWRGANSSSKIKTNAVGKRDACAQSVLELIKKSLLLTKNKLF